VAQPTSTDEPAGSRETSDTAEPQADGQEREPEKPKVLKPDRNDARDEGNIIRKNKV
jgi:hypothetical protein